MSLKNPILIQAEIKRLDDTIHKLLELIKQIEDEDTKHLYSMSLIEHKARKSALEWVFK